VLSGEIGAKVRLYFKYANNLLSFFAMKFSNRIFAKE